MNIPGDLSDTARYFSQDITDPPFVLEGGQVVVNPQGFEAGLGCQLNEAVLNELAVQNGYGPKTRPANLRRRRDEAADCF